MRSRYTAVAAIALLASASSPVFGQADRQPGSGETVLLDFTADWCGYCRQMTPIVDALGRAGHPVRTVDVDREPQLAARYRATSLPCFVMIVDGREVDRVVGATSRERLLAMLAHAQRTPSSGQKASSQATPTGAPATFAQVSGPTRPAATQMPVAKSSEPFRPTADANASPRIGEQLASAAGPQTFAPKAGDAAPSPTPVSVPVSAKQDADSPPLVSATGGVDIAAVPRSVIERALAASVRLRVEDSGGRSWGSGTIVDVTDGRALVVTCAHIFRESGGNTPVTIDLYGDGTPKGLTGKVVSYDLPSDVALLSFDAPSDLAFMPVADATYSATSRDPVVSVGCGHGTMPTAIVSRVVSIDRFLGPPNLQVAGQPVQGRSGGGLFSADGHMIGVCNAADPQDDQGLYAALGAIHAELDRSQLSYVYKSPRDGGDILLASTGALDRSMLPAMPERRRDPTDGGPVNTAARGAVGPGASAPAAQRTPAPATQPPATQPPAGLAPVTLPSRRAAPGTNPATAAVAQPAAALPAAAGLSPAELGALDAIGRAGDDAEVIVIVRSRSNPAAKSQIIVLDHASPTLLNHLSSARPGAPRQGVESTQPPASQPPASQLAPPISSQQRLAHPGQSNVARR